MSSNFPYTAADDPAYSPPKPAVEVLPPVTTSENTPKIPPGEGTLAVTVAPSTPAKTKKMVWITGAWPPDIMGPAVGIIERAQWFDKHSPFELTCIIPEKTDGTYEQAGVKNVLPYPAKPWPVAMLFQAPTIRSGRKIAKLIREVNPDIILHGDLERVWLLTSWSVPGRAWAKKHNIPYLGYYHTDYIGFAKMHPIWGKLSFVVKFMMYHCYHKLSATLAPSASGAEIARNSGANNVIGLPFDGVNTDYFVPQNRSPQRLAEFLGYEPQGPVVLSFSRISPEKRINHIVDALTQLQKTPGYENTTLIIAGNGEHKFEEGIAKYAKKIPRQNLVHIVGAIRGDTRTMLLASVDVLVMASPKETFGITVTEAMSSHTPVVCVDSGAPATYVLDGQNGFIAKAGDINSLVATIKRALAADREAIGIKARTTVIEKFSMKAICAGLNDFYLKFLEDPSYKPPIPAGSPLFSDQ